MKIYSEIVKEVEALELTKQLIKKWLKNPDQFPFQDCIGKCVKFVEDEIVVIMPDKGRNLDEGFWIIKEPDGQLYVLSKEEFLIKYREVV